MTLDLSLLLLLLLAVNANGDHAVPDWLVNKIEWATRVSHSPVSNTISIGNGLIEKTFLLRPGFVSVDFYSYEKNASLLRALSPEVNGERSCLIVPDDPSESFATP